MKSKEEPRVVSGGLGWPRVASGGLGWPRVASGGLGKPFTMSGYTLAHLYLGELGQM